MTANQTKFLAALADAFTTLFQTPEYAYAASRTNPIAMADKFFAGIPAGTANWDGEGVKAACKACGIKQTRKAIMAFLA